ncbi:MAG TPA: carboxypeptidase-like regulatory domain-containing protein [Thermoanaerobaculia bacterium]|nr:carboxypeptidase-like regulatory domain-containing protein [Thermoanaerobaculia bacterium]
MTPKKERIALTVPIDIGNAADAAEAVKVALVDGSGKVIQSQVVKTGDKAAATFELDAVPRGARVVIGPQDADDESLPKLQTVSAAISPRAFTDATRVTLPAVRIPSYYWPWWLRWCRTFTITGTVLCPDGKPVPGAQVCAFDVDWFWFWQSKQQIGCAVTDVNGFFKITFRWCCGWYPWWWWQLRSWQIDTKLAAELYQTLPPELRIKPIPLPDPAPDLGSIEALIPQSRKPAGLRPAAPISARAASADDAVAQTQSLRVLKDTTSDFLTRAEALRPTFAELLPNRNALRIWPWYPWYPWNDCNPDVLFQVTQACGGKTNVIVDQGYAQTQWDIPTSYNVTLIANGDACCAEDTTDCGDPCLSITHVCDLYRSHIDQTTGSATAGLAYPGTASAGNKVNADRPFAESIAVRGLPSCMGDDVDYYGVEYAQYNGSSWNAYAPMPLSGLGAFTRGYYVFGSGSNTAVAYVPTIIGGHAVYPSRRKLEASLATPWVCLDNCQLLFIWLTNSAAWADGTYRLRVQPYKETSPGVLTPQQLPECADGEPNEIVITIDNRPSPDPAHLPPGTPDHPCGAGTVHICTKEPDCDVEAVRLRRADGTVVDIVPCGIYTRQPGDSLEIDFAVDDRDDHLAWYTFDATYGENQVSDLLTGTTLTPITADAVGPQYYDALTQGATAPKWHGGRITVTIPAAQIALKLPDPCCYQLELRAYKRTIANCDYNFTHYNLAEYSFFY